MQDFLRLIADGIWGDLNDTKQVAGYSKCEKCKYLDVLREICISVVAELFNFAVL